MLLLYPYIYSASSETLVAKFFRDLPESEQVLALELGDFEQLLEIFLCRIYQSLTLQEHDLHVLCYFCSNFCFNQSTRYMKNFFSGGQKNKLFFLTKNTLLLLEV